MKKIAISYNNSELSDFRSCNSFTIIETDDQGKKDEMEKRAKSCAGIIDKIFQLIDAKIETLYVKEILDEDKIVLENANIEVIIADSISNIKYH